MKRYLSLFALLLVSFAVMGCSASSTPSVETQAEATKPAAEEDLGPLTVQDCKEIGDLVDAETGYSCLIGVAIETNDRAVCDNIPADNAQRGECEQVVGGAGGSLQ